jgi:probable O-glycosylation ligase (exosortase A-associated)
MALNPDAAQELWIKTLKIQLMVFLTMALFNDEKRITQLIWVVAFSIGFFGIKGGVFTIITGGSFIVWGPADSFIADNNELAVALLMVLPLMYYLFSRLTVSWHRKAIIICMVLMVASIVGSQSRGAFLSIGAVGGYFWLQSDRKFLIAFLLLVLIAALFLFLPDSWFDRMNTIENYEEDESAMSRIRAWTLAYHLANERLFGGGFNMWNVQTYAAFSPLYEPGHKPFVAHSIYFSILGEQGWPGLILFLTIFWLSWRTTSQLAKNYKNSTELKWVSDLARMLKISLLAYLTGGAFLSLAYFDLPWQIVALVVLLKAIAERSTGSAGEAEDKQERVSFVRSSRD